MESDYWGTIGHIADALSIIAVGITLWTLRTVRRIERTYLSQARLPEVLKALEDHKRLLSRHIRESGAEGAAFDGAVASYRETLLAAKRIAMGDAKTAVVREIDTVKAWASNATRSADVAWRIYNGAQAVKTALD